MSIAHGQTWRWVLTPRKGRWQKGQVTPPYQVGWDCEERKRCMVRRKGGGGNLRSRRRGGEGGRARGARRMRGGLGGDVQSIGADAEQMWGGPERMPEGPG